MRSNNNVRSYFELRAKNYDEIYDWIEYNNYNKVLKKILNKFFRKGMIERYKLVIKECNFNKKILDIGCGSGRMSLILAKKESDITGIDYSKHMLNLAKDYLRIYKEKRKINTELKIKYTNCDFMENYNVKEQFDITLAIGLFDYIKNPLPFLKKMKSLTKEKMIISFPSKYSIQVPIRKVWLLTKKCPVYFYTKKKILSMFHSIYIKEVKIIKIPAGYLIVAFLNS